MMNLIEKMKGGSDRIGGGGKMESEISLTPMNLSTMLSSNRGSRDFPSLPSGSVDAEVRSLAMLHHHQGRLSDSSLSPNGGEEDADMMDEEEEDMMIDESKTGGGAEAESSSSNSSRQRHTSADIRAQFMADLKRLGGNIPTQSGASAEEQTATSTTASPPPPPSSSSRIRMHQPSEENNLPPRKRKVSQEQHSRLSVSQAEAPPGMTDEKRLSPYNGIQGGSEEDRNKSPNASASPIQEESGSKGLTECKN